MKYVLLLITLIVPVLLTRCEMEAVDVNTPEFEQKLVLAGFISPDEAVSYLNISSNWELFGPVNLEHSTGNLSGTLSDGVSSITLDTFRLGLKFDQKKMKLDYGKTYHLKILSDLGLSAEATCIIPEKRPIRIEYDTVWTKAKYFRWSQDEKNLLINVYVNDIEGEENYYNIRLSGKAWGKDPNGWTGTYVLNDFGPCLSDKGLDGTRLSWQKYTGVSNYVKLDSAHILIYLYQTEKSYYLYHKSLEKYDHGDNPFSEATPVFSNIKGGLGIFSSYTVDSVIVSLK